MDMAFIKERALAELDAQSDPGQGIALALASLQSDFGAEPERYADQMQTVNTLGMMSVMSGVIRTKDDMRKFITDFSDAA